MNLGLFTSKRGTDLPNLVSLQDGRLTALPTLLVCPLVTDLTETPARVRLQWRGQSYVAACDLLRPINRKLLQAIGELDDVVSREIMSRFLKLLAD